MRYRKIKLLGNTITIVKQLNTEIICFVKFYLSNLNTKPVSESVVK